jgi:hypothetical protein
MDESRDMDILQPGRQWDGELIQMMEANDYASSWVNCLRCRHLQVRQCFLQPMLAIDASRARLVRKFEDGG